MAKNFISVFFRDMLLEEKEGKYSTKKAWGHILMTLVSITYILDGWEFYNINEHLFDSMLVAGVTLIGLTFVKDIIKRKPSTTPKK